MIPEMKLDESNRKLAHRSIYFDSHESQLQKNIVIYYVVITCK